MKNFLHIIATPRQKLSRTLKVTNNLLHKLQEKYPKNTIDELNLFEEDLPTLDKEVLKGKYVLMQGQELSAELKDSWKVIEKNIERFLKADLIIISTPMWNFGIPYVLKHYIDVIVQPEYLFKYGEKGPEGLAQGKKMIIITSRGGDYSAESPAKAYDLQEPYLRTIFGFVGIRDLSFVNAQPMDAGGSEIQEKKIQEAISSLQKLEL